VPEEEGTAHRLAAYTDAVFAVIVTVMVLELKAPERPAFSALSPLWPTAVSYLFIAIIWVNHHHLMRAVGRPTLSAIQLPPKRTRMRRRSGSAYSNLFGNGSGTRNRPIAPAASGPCCHDSPMAFFRWG
jgi:hypothetical protein